MLQARSSVAERCPYTAEAGVQLLPRLYGNEKRCTSVGRASVGVRGSRSPRWRIPFSIERNRAAVSRATSSLVCLLFGCVLLVGCATPPPDVPAASAQQANSEYVIGSGDTLSVFVYQAPELSEAGVAVRPDGRISIPLVQDIRAAGLTPPDLAKRIEQRLKKYVRDPNVTVIVRSFVGPFDRQVRVIGQATVPEAIPYRDGMSLLDVMIATKGLTKFAAGNQAFVIRRLPDGKEDKIHVRLSSLLNDGDMSQNIKMRPGDTLIIPQTWF